MTAHDAHVWTRDEIALAADREMPRGWRLAATVFSIVGLVTFVAGVFLDPDRAWRAFHVNWLFFTLISSAGVMFVAAQRITTARWSRPVIRFLEGYVAFLPIAFLFLLLILFVGGRHIFPWLTVPPTAHEKRTSLNPAFQFTRDIVVFSVIALLSLWYVYSSVRLDVGLLPEGGSAWARAWRERMRRGFRDERREIHSTHSLQGKLAVFLAMAFAFFWSVLAWDLSMGLDVHFQSTLYGWWVFMGGWLGALMTFSLLTMWWRRHLNAYDIITENHFHDLGKLCFAFTVFWAYLTFGQYLVLWYGNLGEETHWPRLRLIHPWVNLSLAVVFLMFVMPFFGLISRAAKIFLPTFIAFATCSIVGLWLHRYLEVYPSLYGVVPTAPLGGWELGVTLGYLGVWGLCYAAFMDAFPKMRVTLMTSPFRDEVQVPVNPETMEPLPAHE